MKTLERAVLAVRNGADYRWITIWTLGLLFLLLWDILFLNTPALKAVAAAYLRTLLVAALASGVTLFMGWATAVSLHAFETRSLHAPYYAVSFCLNLLRSVPQVVGVLFGYVFLASLLSRGTLSVSLLLYGLMAVILSLFVFLEVSDLMRERIAFFKNRDFYDGLRVCGVKESRIVNFDILWKNSRVHVLNKLISVFGMAVFLQCSVDFIISVGLSRDVNSVSLPPTLGTLLASIDSKQDILAVGNALTHPAYALKLPFVHLQGLTVAFLIVFTLLCVYRIGNGYAERHRL